nr:MAG TPA: hypothetical protein [Caudoviricetes sp.]
MTWWSCQLPEKETGIRCFADTCFACFDELNLLI